MSSPNESLKQLQATLASLRQDHTARRRFPKEVWNSIINLTKSFSIDEVAETLHIHPAYLKRKIAKSSSAAFDFQEVSIQSPPDMIFIELESPSGLKAKIQGPISCLNSLQLLFRR